MLEKVQVIRENNEAKFAVIPFEEYLSLKDLRSNEEKLADYLDYLHMQQVKEQDSHRYSMDEVMKELAIESIEE